MQDVLVLKEGEMFLEHKILALCDPETDYAGQLAAYLQDSREFPWEIRIFTGISQLTESEKSEEIDLLLVAESVYFPELPVEPGTTVLLNESGLVRWSFLRNVDKYQPAENVLRLSLIHI